MLTGVSPSCVAVPRDVDDWKLFHLAPSLISTLELCTLKRRVKVRLVSHHTMSEGDISVRNTSTIRSRHTKFHCRPQSLNRVLFRSLTVPRPDRFQNSRQHLPVRICQMPNACQAWDMRRSSRKKRSGLQMDWSFTCCG